jgi:tubulin beta
MSDPTALFNCYLNKGLKTVEFDEARSNMTGLIQEDEMYEPTRVDECGEGKEDNNKQFKK